MSRELLLLRIGAGARLTRLLTDVRQEIPLREIDSGGLAAGAAAGKRLMFAVHVDAYGADAGFCELLRTMRRNPACLRGSAAVIVVDGEGELYTKSAAQELALAASFAGCMLPGKPLVEGTGSLYNQHILATQRNLCWEETYFQRARELASGLLDFSAPRFRQPELLMLHASDNARSNTVWMGREIVRRLQPECRIRELSLQNGSVYDCRGCSYEACLHFAQNHGCFYGGAISEEVLPAIRRCNAMLFLCPNYNDAVSANIMALFNRLTNLLVQQNLSDKYLFGIVVSGYSGSDLVARQLLGAMCFNKTAILPPYFCLMQTAHDPGSAQKADGIAQRLDGFAENMRRILLE